MKAVSKIIAGLSATATLLTLNTAFADAPNYSTVEFGYMSIKIDDGPTPDGNFIDGSAELNKNIFVEAGHSAVKKKISNYYYSETLEQKITYLGLGVKQDINDSTSLYGNLDVIKVDMGDEDDDGSLVEAGIRSNVTNNFELFASLLSAKAFDDSATELGIGAAFMFTPNVGLALRTAQDDDKNVTSTLGVRFAF